MTTNLQKKRPKVVAFDVDETLGNFVQFSIFFHVLEEYFDKPDIPYRYFNDLVDLYPEIVRPSILRILEYIRKKKSAGVCSKVFIYTNNQGPDKWVAHIRDYFEHKLRTSGIVGKVGDTTSTSASATGLAIIPPLFDHTIGGFKPNQNSPKSRYPPRTTSEKTVKDFIHCSLLPSDIEICFLDDVTHPKMTDERVYYIKLQGYYSYIPFDVFVKRFLDSALYRQVFDRFMVLSVTSSMTATVKRQILSIEMNDLFAKRANMARYDARAIHNKMNPREIDEIISKYIIYHLQQFFRDGPPELSVQHHPRNKTSTVASVGHRGNKTAKKNSSNLFYVDKTTAVKNMRNKTIKNR